MTTLSRRRFLIGVGLTTLGGLLISCGAGTSAVAEARSSKPRQRDPQTSPNDARAFAAGHNAFGLALYGLLRGAGGWSPDGRQIAFTSRYNLYVMNADGSNKTKLSTDRGVAEEYAWSPNGRQLAFLVYDGVGQWWSDVVNADGSGLTELSECRNPAWSPDGHQIACAGIYVMNADGSHRIKLTNDSESNWGPVWSPPLK
jgi:sugar lactone lactonase YvrE